MNATRSGVAIRVAFIAAAAILFLAGTSQAQSGALRATMPFSFYAGDQLLPAGEYEIRAVGNGVVKLSNFEAMNASEGVNGYSRLNRSSDRNSAILRRRQNICSASRP